MCKGYLAKVCENAASASIDTIIQQLGEFCKMTGSGVKEFVCVFQFERSLKRIFSGKSVQIGIRFREKSKTLFVLHPRIVEKSQIVTETHLSGLTTRNFTRTCVRVV